MYIHADWFYKEYSSVFNEMSATLETFLKVFYGNYIDFAAYIEIK